MYGPNPCLVLGFLSPGHHVSRPQRTGAFIPSFPWRIRVRVWLPFENARELSCVLTNIIFFLCAHGLCRTAVCRELEPTREGLNAAPSQSTSKVSAQVASSLLVIFFLATMPEKAKEMNYQPAGPTRRTPYCATNCCIPLCLPF